MPQHRSPGIADEPFERVPTSAYLPREEALEFDAARVRYWTYPATEPRLANQPTVVMVHGFRGDHHGLALIADALRHRWDVVVPDLPGFGASEPFTTLPHTTESYAAVVRAVIAAVGGPVVLVGHSFGSIIAARVARDFPQTVRALALINPICEPALDSSQRIPALAASAFYWVSAALPDRLGNALVRSGVVTRVSSELMMKTGDPALRAYINGQHCSYFGSFASRRVVLEAYGSSIRDTVADDATSIPAPTLLIVAERDDLGSVPAQERLADLFEDARMRVIPRVGHLIHYETPRRAAAMVDDFADEVVTRENRAEHIPERTAQP